MRLQPRHGCYFRHITAAHRLIVFPRLRARRRKHSLWIIRRRKLTQLLVISIQFPLISRERSRSSSGRFELNPNDATAHHWFGNQLLANTGQREREFAEMKRALELDPLSLVINTNFGVAYLNQGRTDEAIAQLRKTLEMDGNFYYGRENLGLALEVKGEIPEAIAEFQKAVALTDDPVPLDILVMSTARSGEKMKPGKSSTSSAECEPSIISRPTVSPSCLWVLGTGMTHSIGWSKVIESVTALTSERFG